MSDKFDMSKIFVEDEDVAPEVPKATKKKKPQPDVVLEEEVVLPEGNNIIRLPSNGALGYPAEVEFRDIMVSDEEVLATATPETYGRVLNGVLKSLLMNCPFFEKMSVHDRDYALLWIWSTNYTPKKTMQVECGSCSHKAEHVVDMTALPFVAMPTDVPVPFKLPIKKTGGHVLVRPSTVADELFAEDFSIKNPKIRHETVMMARTIDLGMEVPMDKKLKWISTNVSGKEMGYVRKYHAKMAFGLETSLKYECPECHEVTHGDLPFQTEDILFPVVSDDFDELLYSNQDNEDQSD